jgi:polysaccharide export outer membrane protein
MVTAIASGFLLAHSLLRRSGMRGVLFFGCLSLLAGCRHDPGVFTWIDDYADPMQAEGQYVIREGDLVNVRVYGQDSMSAHSRVRADGKISMPFLNDVTAAGFTPVVLSAQLQTRLKDFINNPVVTISLEEVRAVNVSVLGEVLRPGVYNLDPASTGVLQAIASAGGFTNFAARDLFVLRSSPTAEKPQRIRFDYETLSRAQGKGAGFRLKAGDVLIVE